MTPVRCPECGAQFGSDTDTCAERFDTLIALDHSRREPWGSRHGQAFATFALQHPLRYPASLDHAWAALYRIHCLQQSPAQVFGALRGRPRPAAGKAVIPPRPDSMVSAPTVTIVDLAGFEAPTYPAQLDAWSRATLVAWGATLP